jgi:hypothetical protein
MSVRVVWVAVALWCWAPLAQAQNINDASRAAARQLGYQGVESYQAGDYPTATTKLEKAFQVLQVPSLGLWSARALIKTGRWVEAAERLRRVSRLEAKGGDAAVQQQAQEEAKAELDRLTPRIPTLVVTVEGAREADVQLMVDGEAIASALIGEPVPANPGKHVIVGKVGEQERSQTSTLAEGSSGKVVLRFEATGAAPTAAAAAVAPASQPADADTASSSEQASGTRRILSWALIGTGAAGVVLGATTGVIALGKKSDLEASTDCRAEQRACLPSQRDEIDSYNTMRTISTIGLVGGAALAATGIVLMVTAPKSDAGQQASNRWWLRVTPTGGSLAGSF